MCSGQAFYETEEAIYEISITLQRCTVGSQADIQLFWVNFEFSPGLLELEPALLHYWSRCADFVSKQLPHTCANLRYQTKPQHCYYFSKATTERGGRFRPLFFLSVGFYQKTGTQNSEKNE